MNLNIDAIHLNHQTRGDENRQDEQFCRELCKKLKVPLRVKSRNVPELAKNMGISLEEAGRQARLEIFEKIIEMSPKSLVATGHNRDDQAETLLMRIITGTSPGGLSGIRRNYRGFIVRPLIDTSKNEILEYLHQNGIKYRTDPSNQDTCFLRNRVRHQLLPLLRQKFNPRVTDALCRLAESMQMQNQVMEEAAGKVFAQAVSTTKDRAEVDVNVINSPPPPTVMTVLRQAAIAAGVNGKEMSRRHGQNLLKLVEKQPGSSVELPGGYTACRGYDRIVIQKPAEPSPVPPPVELTLPGRVEMPERGLAITGEYREPCDAPVKDGNPFNVILDADVASAGKYTLRCRVPGDRFYPLGSPGSRKLKSFLIDRKVPRETRDHLPLLVKDGEILWVAGIEINEKCRVKQASKRVLNLRIEKLEK